VKNKYKRKTLQQ